MLRRSASASNSDQSAKPRPPRRRAVAGSVARCGGRRPQTQRPSLRPGFADPDHSHNRVTLATYTHATYASNSPLLPRLKRPFLEPAVDTPQKRDLGNSVESLYFSAICRTFRSGGTRIRTGDTMIFSHIQKPIGMRIYRIGKRIYVQRVPGGTAWFCPYCCATVDTAFVT
jgi:hypothetical protein